MALTENESDRNIHSWETQVEILSSLGLLVVVDGALIGSAITVTSSRPNLGIPTHVSFCPRPSRKDN
jgi:hypothetical protein